MTDVMPITQQATEYQQQARAALASEEESDVKADDVDRLIQTR